MVITLVIDDILSVNKADVGVIVMLPNEYSSSRTDRGTHVLLLPGITSIVTGAIIRITIMRTINSILSLLVLIS